MLETYTLDIEAMLEYARRWAFSRNPDFYSFDDIGGDCTNFVSQCIYAGGAVMNYTPDVGWYYISLYDRAAAWTGVEFFHTFMTENKGAGPFGYDIPVYDAAVGDVIQLGTGDTFYHSLLVVNVIDGVPYVAAHDFDAFDRPLPSYTYNEVRCIRIAGARKYV